MSHKIILILNKDKQRVCEQYCYKELDLDKSIIEKDRELVIYFKYGGHFKHEFVKNIERFEEHGLKITTSKKEWFIY